MSKKWFFLLLMAFCFACNENNTEKYQGNRGNVVDVSSKLTVIEFDDILFNMIVEPYIFNDNLVIVDRKSDGSLIYIFDKNTFSYITSAGKLGRGPGEISSMGDVEYDEIKNELLVTDHTKQCVFSYNMDSLLINPLHLPYEKTKLDVTAFIIRYVYINDTLSIGELIEPTGNCTFRESLAKWNMVSGALEKMPYEHPDIEEKRISFAVSEKYGIYVEGYNYHDLMTICSLDGNLKYNVYGNKWDSKNSKKMVYYAFGLAFCGDKILAMYMGENNINDNGTAAYATKFLVFDINGDYIETLEIGRSIIYFCYDDENNRLIMTLDDEMQFAYLDLNGLI